jgi:hypothetical protein
MPKRLPPDVTQKGKKVYGSITKSADLLDERISEVSNVSKTISNMQKKVDKKVKDTKRTLEDNQNIEEVHKSLNAVLSKLGDTIGALGKGITNITIATAKASKDAIGDYARAVGRDINYNKQNIVAMALSQSSPIFGYFAAKFMETDVFRKAKERISSSFSNMFSAVFRKLRFGKKGKKKDQDEYELPHMARGGYVRRGGLAKLHSAEVVMPIDKFLKSQSKAIKQAIIEKGNLSNGSKIPYQEKMLVLVSSILNQLEEEDTPSKWKKFHFFMMKSSFYKATVNFIKATKKLVTGPAKLISSVYKNKGELAVLGYTLSKTLTLALPKAFSLGLIKSFATTNLLGLGYGAAAVVLYKLGRHKFGVNRGYYADLPKGKNFLQNIASIVGMTYAQQMSRLDSLIVYTKATAQAIRDLSTSITGIKYPTIPDISTERAGWSIFGFLKKGLGKLGNLALKNLVSGGNDPTGKKQDLLSGSYFKRLKYNIFTSKKQKLLDNHPLLQNGLYGTEDTKSLFRPFSDKTSPGNIKKLVQGQKEYYDVMLNKRRGWRKLIANTEDTVKELREINRRETRRTITSAIGSLFGMVGGMGKGLFNIIGDVFKIGGPLGIIGSLFGFLFGGSGKTGKGSVIGGVIERAGSLVGRSIKRGFWGFMGMFKKGGVITKFLDLAMLPVKALGSTVMDAIKGFKLLPFLKGVGWFGLGVVIGELANYIFDLDKKFGKYLDDLNKTTKELSDIANKSNQKNVADINSNIPEEKRRGHLGIQLRNLVKMEETTKSAGWLSGSYLPAIMDAQKQFMQEHLEEYQPFSETEINSMRKVWLEKGGLGFGQSLNILNVDPKAYGERYEKDFLEFLKEKGRPMGQEEKNYVMKQYDKKKEKTTAEKLKEEAGKITGQVVDNVEKAIKNVQILYNEEGMPLWDEHGKPLWDKYGDPLLNEYGLPIYKKYMKPGIASVSDAANEAYRFAKPYGNQAVNIGKDWMNRGIQYGSEKASEVQDMLPKDLQEAQDQLATLKKTLFGPNNEVVDTLKKQTKELTKAALESGQTAAQGVLQATTTVVNNVTQSVQNAANNHSGQINSVLNNVKDRLMVLQPDWLH